MPLNLSNALRTVCCLIGGCALLYMAMPFIDVALHRYDSPVAAVAGVFLCLFAVPFYFASRSKAATEPWRSRPVVAGLLWAAVIVFSAIAFRLLYFGIRLYV
jgi:hypothetical protein